LADRWQGSSPPTLLPPYQSIVDAFDRQVRELSAAFFAQGGCLSIVMKVLPQ
jgi:hypothetical protein